MNQPISAWEQQRDKQMCTVTTPEVISQKCGQGASLAQKRTSAETLLGGEQGAAWGKALGGTEQFSSEPTQWWVMWLLNLVVLGKDYNALNCKRAAVQGTEVAMSR